MSVKGVSMVRSKTNYTRQLINDYCVIDTETTGLSAKFDSVIEIALLRVRGNQIVDQYSQLIFPEEKVFCFEDDGEDELTEEEQSIVNKIMEMLPSHDIDDEEDDDDDEDDYEDSDCLIDPFITELTGITSDMVRDAPRINEIEDHVLAFIGDDVLLGHNTSFDIRFLNENFKKKIENKYMDTMPFSRKVYPNFPNHGLSFLTEQLGLAKNEHRALADCIATKELYDNLKNYMSVNKLEISDLWPTSSNGKIYGKRIDISSIKAQTDDIDEDNIFYQKHVVFTGTLSSMSRREAMQLVVNAGGILDNSVVKKTNFLILGSTDYNVSLRGEKSSKWKKAEKMISEGYDIKIIDEDTFLSEI